MVHIVWQVVRQPRRPGARLQLAKETSFEDMMDGIHSFESFLRVRAPQVEDEELLEVKVCTDGTSEPPSLSGACLSVGIRGARDRAWGVGLGF